MGNFSGPGSRKRCRRASRTRISLAQNPRLWIQDYWIQDYWIQDYWIQDYWIQDYWAMLLIWLTV
jgi:hypothetical protein